MSAPTAAAVSPDRTICPPPWRVASASVATAWAAASLHGRGERRFRKKGKPTSLLQQDPFPPGTACQWNKHSKKGTLSQPAEVIQNGKSTVEEECVAISCFQWLFDSLPTRISIPLSGLYKKLLDNPRTFYHMAAPSWLWFWAQNSFFFATESLQILQLHLCYWFYPAQNFTTTTRNTSAALYLAKIQCFFPAMWFNNSF